MIISDASVDRTETELQRRTLGTLLVDPAKLTEGVAVAIMLDDLIRAGSSPMRPAEILEVTTALFGHSRQRALAWVRTHSRATSRYLEILSQAMETFEVEHQRVDGSDRFLVWDAFPGRPKYLRPLPDLLAKLCPEIPQPVARKNETENCASRREAMFRDYLAPRLGDRIWDELGLKRHFMNDVVGLRFPYAIDLDTIVAAGPDIWALEYKHKFPYYDEGVTTFGINTGELDRFGTLVAAGLRILHIIVVKPHRDITRGSIELFNDVYARRNSRVLAIELTADLIAELRVSRSTAARATARDARTTLYTRPIPATWFDDLGALSDAHLPTSLIDKLYGIARPACSQELLEQVRID